MNILLDVPDARADVRPADPAQPGAGTASLFGAFAARTDMGRANLRTALVAESLSAALAELGPAALNVLDAGGGTGGLAVPLAVAGHHVTVVDPSPDSLAALERRAAEAQVAERITAVQGDLDDLCGLIPPASMQAVLCHGVLEVVDDRASALAAITATLVPGGLLSVLTANRLALVLHRSLAGRFTDAAAALAPTATGPVDFAELTRLLDDAGLEVGSARGVRTVSDLVPGAFLDGDPRAAAMLLDLERKAGDDETLRAIATQLHVLCHRPRA